jgi:hypothetical protein
MFDPKRTIFLRSSGDPKAVVLLSPPVSILWKMPGPTPTAAAL